MTRKEEVLILARQLSHHADELFHETNWKWELQHLRECAMLLRLLNEALPLVENRIRLDCHKQTGLRTPEEIWKKLKNP